MVEVLMQSGLGGLAAHPIPGVRSGGLPSCIQKQEQYPGPGTTPQHKGSVSAQERALTLGMNNNDAIIEKTFIVFLPDDNYGKYIFFVHITWPFLRPRTIYIFDDKVTEIGFDASGRIENQTISP